MIEDSFASVTPCRASYIFIALKLLDNVITASHKISNGSDQSGGCIIGAVMSIYLRKHFGMLASIRTAHLVKEGEKQI